MEKIILLLLVAVGAAIRPTPVKLAYLTQNRFDLQNSFVSNLFAHIENDDLNGFAFELASYDTAEDIQKCLFSGACLAALDYDSTPIAKLKYDGPEDRRLR